MKGGIGNIMKQAQQMQENMQRAQEEINSLIDQYGDSFMDNAKNVLAEYCERAQHNIDTIQQLLASAENPTAVFK